MIDRQNWESFRLDENFRVTQQVNNFSVNYEVDLNHAIPF